MIPIEFSNSMYLWATPFAMLGIVILTLIKFRRGPRFLARRILLAISFSIIAGLILLSLSEPFIIMEQPLKQSPELEIIYDQSASMTLYDIPLARITQQLEGVVPYKVTTIGDNVSTPLLSRTLSRMREHGNILIVSDGRDTEDDITYFDVLSKAIQTKSNIHIINLSVKKDEQSVSLEGPQTSIAGVDNGYRVHIQGEGAWDQVLVTINDNHIFRGRPGDDLQFSHKFDREGTYQFKVTLETTRDATAENNVFYKTTRIIPKPNVLYIGNDKQMTDFLNQFTQVTQANSIPENMDAYVAAVLHNYDATASQANMEVLEDFVSQGNGLVVIGGNKAFEYSRYDSTPLAPMLPVQSGKSQGSNRTAIVLLIDISASQGTTQQVTGFTTTRSDDVSRLTAYDIVRSISEDNLVGVIAYYQYPHLVQPLAPLGTSRQTVLDKISRLSYDKAGSYMHDGLKAAWQMLEPVSGAKHVILISDGHTSGATTGPTREVAQAMANAGIRVHTIGIEVIGGVSGQGFMHQVARETGGIYVQPNEREGIKLLFGKATDFEETHTPLLGVHITDKDHPITMGITDINTILSNINAVIPKQNSQVLAVTTNGDPAIVSWRYGLGRVTTVSAFTGTQSMGTLLSPPDSRLLARTISYAIGDPEKKLPPRIRIDDTTLGRPALVTATGPLPTHHDIAFSSLAENLHTAFIVPATTGMLTEYGATFGVSYPYELRYMSPDSRLAEISEESGGKAYRVETIRDIQDAMQKTASLRENQVIELSWMLLALAAVLFIISMLARKLEEKRQ